jgi:ElaB/YqjD/DUF883 family membrane-anchored ribosome-binding protein
MTPSKSNAKTEPQEKTEAQELREEIDETRGDLGDTVEQLAQKADVKAQAQAKVDDVKGQAQAKVDDVKGQAQAKVGQVQENPKPVAGIAAAVAGLLVLLFLLRRR